MMKSNSEQDNRNGPLIVAGIVSGLGIGGFFDGIVLHQILQWHHMLTNVHPTTTLFDLEVNTLGDGLFHAGTWIITLIGIALLWRAGGRHDVPWSLEIFGGSLLIGAGLFNLIEGLIDHHILGLHHVKSGPNELAWDLGFLGLGAILAIVGWLILRLGQRKILATHSD